MGLSVRFPANCKTEASRIAWSYRALELLRVYHNVMGAWSKDAIGISEWQKLPSSTKAGFPFKSDLISGAEWKDYQDNYHRPKEQAVIAANLANRAAAKSSSFWNIDIDGDIN